jgi:hypothetical protein
VKSDSSSFDLFRGEQSAQVRRTHVPHQPSSVTSTEAAKRIAPVFHGNRRACFLAIQYAHSSGGTTRKQIAERYFDAKQNYVTGPVAILMEEGFVYEDPMRDRHGAIVTREDGTIVPRRIDGSAVLLLTPKGRAVAA